MESAPLTTESSLEQTFARCVRAHGGTTVKYSASGCRGMPDRIVLLPGGRTVFAELKRPGSRFRSLQAHRADQLRLLGFPVYCVDSKEAVDRFIQEVFYGDIPPAPIPNARH